MNKLPKRGVKLSKEDIHPLRDVNQHNSLTSAPIYYVTEIIKRVIRNGGDIEIPISIPDSFEFDLKDYNYSSDLFSFDINMSKGSLSGVSDCRLIELNFLDTEPAIQFNIIFPFLNVYAEHYELRGNISDILPLKGEGVAHVEFYNLQLWGTLYLKQEGKSVVLDKLENAGFRIKRIVSKTEIDHNIDEIFSAMVEDLLAVYLTRFNKYLTVTYSDHLVQYINDIIFTIESDQTVFK